MQYISVLPSNLANYFYVELTLKEFQYLRQNEILIKSDEIINNKRVYALYHPRFGSHVNGINLIINKRVDNKIVFDIVSSLWNPTKGTISSHINPNIKGTFPVSNDDQIFDDDIKNHYLQSKNQTFLISLDFSRLMDYFIKSSNTHLTRYEKIFKGLSYMVHDYTVNESFYLIRKYIKFEIPSHIKPYFDKCKIVLITGHECILHSDFYDWDVLFKKINLSPEKFILLSNDCRLGSKNNIPTVYNNALSRIIMPFNHKLLIENKIKKIKDKQINKWYGLCLNRVPKPHRILMANFFDTVLPDKINYSLGLRNINQKSKRQQLKAFNSYMQQIDAIYLHKLINYNIERINIFKKIRPWLEKHKEKTADGEANIDFSIDNINYSNNIYKS